MISRHLSNNPRHISHLQNLSDEMLVADAKRGNKLALVELWSRHGNVARSALWRITGNIEDTEDVLQETYLKSFLHIKQFDGRSKFSTWLMRIAINSALMLLRKRRSRPEVSFESSDKALPSRQLEFLDHSVDIESGYVRLERADQLRKAVLDLRPSLRHVVEIQQRDEATITQVAESAGLSVSATKSRLLRALTALRRSLAHSDSRNMRSPR